jgi:16S rRNA (adenine1518-N6/adenine1519-N6)-dimethyltransferase
MGEDPARSPTLERPDPLEPARLGAEQLRRYLRRHGLAATKRFSQNFLVDGEVLEAIVAAAAPTPGRRILEIGPGLGVLTGALLREGVDLTAVEVDPTMVGHLRSRFEPALERTASEGRLRLVAGDVLDLDVEGLIEPPFDLVANLPYHITSPVLHRMLGAETPPERFVLMLQREVAERITAPPGGLSYLSVFVQYHASVELVRAVPAEAFEPAPDVASAIVAGQTRPRLLAADGEEQLWRLVQAGFRERRKMLHNVLPRQLPQVGRERFEAALAATGIAADRRPQTLSVEEWLALSEAVGPLE